LQLELPDNPILGEDDSSRQLKEYLFNNLDRLENLAPVIAPSESLFSNKLTFEMPDSVDKKLASLTNSIQNKSTSMMNFTEDSASKPLNLQDLLAEFKIS